MRIVSVACTALFLIFPALPGPQATPASTTADASTIACRTLEVHTDDELKVAVVVFHQRDEAQRSRLAVLLREHSGAMVEVQAGDGAWRRARLVRLKSALRRQKSAAQQRVFGGLRQPHRDELVGRIEVVFARFVDYPQQIEDLRLPQRHGAVNLADLEAGGVPLVVDAKKESHPIVLHRTRSTRLTLQSLLPMP
jgi:hypothetical protein